MKNNDLSKKVKALRTRKGFSQEALSEHSGLSLRTIQRVENGETKPTGDSLKKIANALQITPDELIDWTVIEDYGFLKAMNLSALTFILFPLLGVLVPLIMWTSKKDKLKDINTIGKALINFQISWVLILFSGFVLNILWLASDFSADQFITPSIIISSQFRLFVFIIIMYTLNLVFIVLNTFKIEKHNAVFYYPKINFIG
ncbi:DUF4870 domain-containing protein [Formosa undariae]|uniref:DUF4870 domain-containing protein n=1 Tax=Formosa undariae TaxID=1325436 RepID=A0ABV5F2D4_9FLAO